MSSLARRSCDLVDASAGGALGRVSDAADGSDECVLDAEFFEIDVETGIVARARPAILVEVLAPSAGRTITGLQLQGYHVHRGGVVLDGRGRVSGARSWPTGPDGAWCAAGPARFT